MGWRSLVLLVWTSVMFAPSAPAQEAAASARLAVGLSLETSEVHAQGPLTVHVTLTNTSGRDLTILKWHTPLEGFRSDMFQVEQNGVSAPYLGALVKRGSPNAEDLVMLPQGGSVSATVDLFKAYGIFEPGDYTVQFVSTVFVVSGSAARLSTSDPGLTSEDLRSSPIRFKLLERRAPSAEVSKALSLRKPTPESLLRFGVAPTPGFDQCSQEQKAALSNARDNAMLLAAWGAINMWLSKRPNAPYQTWFGEYDDTRYTRVANNFNEIYRVLAHEQALVLRCDDRTEDDCKPISNTIAFVYPSRPYVIHLCPAYWMIPPTGIDSQADTLVHETSHFKVVAGTDDHVYGVASCKDLAIRNPVQAIDNADSHAYFADTVAPSP